MGGGGVYPLIPPVFAALGTEWNSIRHVLLLQFLCQYSTDKIVVRITNPEHLK